MKKRKLVFLLLLGFNLQSLLANECLSAYDYVDKHHVLSEINHNVYGEEVEIKGTLYVRYLENNGSHYTLFWLENGVLEKSKLDKNSLHIPFLVKNTSNDREFLIESLNSVSKEYEIHDRLMGLVDLLQFSSQEAKKFFKNSMGEVELSEQIISIKHNMQRSAQYSRGIIENNIEYYQSDINLTLDDLGCHVWDEVRSKQKIKFMNPLLNNFSRDKQVFLMTKSSNKLPQNHWFFELSTDISKWGFKDKKNALSLNDALSRFELKEQEMLALLGDSKALDEWIKNNLDFLEHLSEMLESKTLNDDVSKSLFSHLSYVNNMATSKILSQVTLNVNLIEKERFRSLMGLKNTDALIPSELLSDIVEYGLNGKGDDFMTESTGMLIGALAKERLLRYPEQAGEIVTSIIDAIHNNSNKKVALAAAGNMLTLAPDSLVETVDNIMMNSRDYETITNASEALLKIERSTLAVESFQELFENQTSIDTKANLIKASASAKDFASNTDYHQELVKLSNNRENDKSSRIAALETLNKTDFGKNKMDKKEIRQMMIGEKNLQISKMLKKLYRRS